MQNHTSIGLIVDDIIERTLKMDKNDGKHKISSAVGVIQIRGQEYEVRVTIDPIKEDWIGETEYPEFVKVEDSKI